VCDFRLSGKAASPWSASPDSLPRELHSGKASKCNWYIPECILHPGKTLSPVVNDRTVQWDATYQGSNPGASFGGAHRGRVCVRVLIGVSVRAYCERLRCSV
jgi:hypothetical protein